MIKMLRLVCTVIAISCSPDWAFASMFELGVDCRAFLAAVRAEALHPSSRYWEIDAAQSEAQSLVLSRGGSPADRSNYEQHPPRPLPRELAAATARERGESRLFDHGRYIERHFSPRTFRYLASHPHASIIVAPGDIEEVASHARGGGARRIEVLPKNSLTDFTVMIAYHSGGRHVVYIQVLPGRSAVIEAVANVLHYELGGAPPIPPTRVSVLDPLHSASARIAELLVANRAENVDAIFFGYSSNLTRVVTAHGGYIEREINEVDLFARVLAVRGKKILSVPVTPYAFGDRAAEVLRGADLALAKTRLVVTVGIAGTLIPAVDVDSYVVPIHFRRNGSGLTFENLALRANLASHRGLRSESVDSILQETGPWLERARAGHIAIVEQEGYDLLEASRALKYPLAAVYRVSDRVGFGFDDFNSIEFSYQPDGKLTAWQNSMVSLLTP